MKQTFIIEIETLDSQSALRDFQIMAALKNSFDEFFDGNARPLSAKETTVEQIVERLKDKEKTLKLSGNIAWENRIEDGDDYLEDRFNDLL